MLQHGGVRGSGCRSLSISQLELEPDSAAIAFQRLKRHLSAMHAGTVQSTCARRRKCTRQPERHAERLCGAQEYVHAHCYLLGCLRIVSAAERGSYRHTHGFVRFRMGRGCSTGGPRVGKSEPKHSTGRTPPREPSHKFTARGSQDKDFCPGGGYRYWLILLETRLEMASDHAPVPAHLLTATAADLYTESVLRLFL